jgi:diaminopimelate decarboxylase
MQNFGSKFIRKAHDSYSYSVYYLKGNDSRLLNIPQQLAISSMIESDKLSSSCLVYNPTEALRKISTWKKTFPWIKPHYAVKSNPHKFILADLVSQGAGLDCASKEEIKESLAQGLSIDSIVYSNPIKNENDLIWAGQQGIKLTTADSIDEIIKIKKYAPNMEILWRISIKEEASDNLATPFSGKFGDDLETDEMINDRMAEIEEMGVKLKGIHFHCGSGHHGSSAFGKAVKFARRCMEIGRIYGHEMSLLDIGGGFPAGELSTNTIEALKPTQNDPLNYRIIAEPGRHFSGNCFYLLTRIIGKRVKSGKPCYHLNDSLYHSFNCNLMDGVSF